MSDLIVPVVKIISVTDHPNTQNLSLNYFSLENKKESFIISNKTEDNAHRYSVGELVVYFPVDVVVPTYLLQRSGYWDDKKKTGMLGGSKGNRVRPRKFAEIASEGIIIPFENTHITHNVFPAFTTTGIFVSNEKGEKLFYEGDNVAEYLGVTAYMVPPTKSTPITHEKGK